MSELRLFSIDGGKVQECHAAFFKLEREIQNLFEANLEALLGVRFVASELSTGQGGRIDTLGIDENGFPVVIEYKLDKNRTVINQGMSYMAAIGHWGTGDLEVKIRHLADIEQRTSLITQAYEGQP